jgi:hypothetical protein
METKYNARHAREILEPCGLLGKYLLLDDRGVWPAVERDLLLLPETEMLRWRPARELQGRPDAPEVIDTPMLPLPFTARELAAFMLAGSGALVSDFYGDWCNGPDSESLEDFDSDSNAHRAVTEAYAAYHLAQEKVGALDASAQTRRDAAHKAYWREPSDKALFGEFKEAQAAWDAAYQAWLTKMVLCLLEPEAAQAPEVGQDASVVEAPASETPEQRRARWLEWYGKGERGAVQRVYERERLLNPKADRAYIGKQIKIAKTEQAEKKRVGGWASQLVQDGKR